MARTARDQRYNGKKLKVVKLALDGGSLILIAALGGGALSQGARYAIRAAASHHNALGTLPPAYVNFLARHDHLALMDYLDRWPEQAPLGASASKTFADW